MPNTILVLDDEADRIATMRDLLVHSFPHHELVFTDNAPDTVEWLRKYVADAVLLCLDHDLGPNRKRNGDLFDPGIGRDVVDLLVTLPPACPVIVHSTNSPAAYGMRAALKEAGWKCGRVIPYGDREWIEEIWLPKVRRALGKHVPNRGDAEQEG